MRKILLTGSTGFIGSNLYKELCKNHEVIRIDREFFKSVDCKDKYFNEDIDYVIHCAYSNDELSVNINMINALHEILLKSKASDKRMIVLGTFASYKNDGELITEKTSRSSAQFKYFQFKKKISDRIVALSKTDSDIRYIELEPTIVMGQGGGWQNLADKISQVKGDICIPLSGDSVCNVIEVQEVVSYIKDILAIDVNRFGAIRYYNFLLNGESKIKWADWFSVYAKIPKSRLKKSSENHWHYNWLVDFLIELYFVRNLKSIFSYNLFKLFSTAGYEPRGLDRYAMRCKATVSSSKIKNFLDSK